MKYYYKNLGVYGELAVIRKGTSYFKDTKKRL